jgi:hypothetical protein
MRTRLCLKTPNPADIALKDREVFSGKRQAADSADAERGAAEGSKEQGRVVSAA